MEIDNNSIWGFPIWKDFVTGVYHFLFHRSDRIILGSWCLDIGGMSHSRNSLLLIVSVLKLYLVVILVQNEWVWSRKPRNRNLCFLLMILNCTSRTFVYVMTILDL